MALTLSRDEILLRYSQGERDFRCLDLDRDEINFDHCILDGAIFSRSFIVASFVGASLQESKFEFANVKTCDFSGANLLSASFRGAAIDAATFIGANLENADFEGATEQGYEYKSQQFPNSNPAN
ncbi:pentapeptide repeat-containing protein [Undibacterium cyanobacteriorum]|uniref:Pentapeptide repeat-containing protein n=1 Tax=Undibacterium cyanobacteriorum TaxID=3073561 RepID=A0ABY9RKW7_9BURK|nr:pentapeptide repeat-containing protein [Undibacterium sp. 20NA77.5]WMW81848.1 pentapeptide repeat-containing protein [Undibacterium sp. 20NA77.5]